MSEMKTRIAIVLDRSSSMAGIRKEAVAMFNDQTATIKKNSADQDTRVSLFTFSTIADEPTMFNAPVCELLELKEEDYVPNGWTAMYDAIGMTIDRLSALKEATEKDCAFLVVIITDGEENRSSKYTGATISDRIKLLQSTGKWTFTFLGANVDVEKMATTLHIPKGNVTSWSASSGGMYAASHVMTSATSTYMANRSSAGGQSCSNFFSGATPQGGVQSPNTAQTVLTPEQIEEQKKRNANH